MRPLMGFDQSSGAMGVGGGVRLGQRLRFMVRDREGAKQDLMEHALSLKRRQLQARTADYNFTHFSDISDFACPCSTWAAGFGAHNTANCVQKCFQAHFAFDLCDICDLIGRWLGRI